MSSLIPSADGLPASTVRIWAREKHEYLRRYLDISRATRKKFLGQGKGGATYIDLFCGPGLSQIQDTSEWIDGSAIAAWKISQEGGAPFSAVYVADLDDERRRACAERLKRLNAPVLEIQGSAVEAAMAIRSQVNPHGLNFAFLDPYSLGALDFRIIEALAGLKRVDMLIHVSAMDLQRNLEAQAASDASAFDQFAPRWRTHVDFAQSQAEVRRGLLEYWRLLVTALGVWPSTQMRMITGSRNQPLYWLLLAAKHELPHRFWKVAANREGQGSLF